MTIDEFMEKLAAAKGLGKWEVCEGEEIRCTIRGPKTGAMVECCPLTAVWLNDGVGRLYVGVDEAWRVGDTIGMDEADTKCVIDSADSEGWADPAVRQRILEAVGLYP